MKLNDCIKLLWNYKRNSDENPEIQHIEMDSRQVKPGDLFICIQGENFDSHNVVDEVIQKGAVALIAEKEVQVSIPVIQVSNSRNAMAIIGDTFYQHPSQSLNLIGVTGTNGKTTVTHLIKELFQMEGRNTGIIGTIGIKYNNNTIPVNNTTPESLMLHEQFSNMKQEGVTDVVMEVSSHALDQGRVRGCDYNIAIFTNLTQDHLEYHHTMEAYLHAKSLLFSQLGNTYKENQVKAGIINVDDPYAPELLKATAVPNFTYGINKDADFKANSIRIYPNGTEFSLSTPAGEFPIKMNLMGKFNVYNVLAAVCAGYVSGLSLERLVKNVEHLSGVSGRFEAVREGQDFTVLVDYSHTPDSLENALSTIQEFAQGRIITVVGCGGDRDRTKRPLMARIAVEKSNLAIFTSDNPRTEVPELIIQDMEKGVTENTYVKKVDRKEAIYYAIQEAKPGDVILIAGKGHETYQIIGKEKHHFDDREVASAAIKERR